MNLGVKVKRLIEIILIFCLSVYCSFGEALSEEGKVIKIGGAFSLTGFGSSFGTGELNGVRLAIDEANKTGGINGKKLELIVEDTKSSSSFTVGAVKKLVSVDKVNYLIGPTWLDTFSGPLPIVDRAKTLVITPSAVAYHYKKDDSQYPLVFSTWYNHKREVRTLLRAISKNGDKKIALFFDLDPYFQATADFIEKISQEYGIEIIKRDDFNLGDINFTPALLKIKKLKADAVLAGFIEESAWLAFLKRRAEMMQDTKFYAFHDIEAFIGQDKFSKLINDITYVAPVAAQGSFADKYFQAFKERPILSASNAYDAMNVLIKALGTANTSLEVANYITKNSFETVTFGSVKFDSLGAISGGEFKISTVSSLN